MMRIGLIDFVKIYGHLHNTYNAEFSCIILAWLMYEKVTSVSCVLVLEIDAFSKNLFKVGMQPGGGDFSSYH